MSVDTLGTSWDQCRSMVQHSFTSTETGNSLGRTAQDGHLDSHTAELSHVMLLRLGAPLSWTRHTPLLFFFFFFLWRMRLLCNLFPEGVSSALPFPQRTANAIIIVSLKAAESTRCYGFAAERLQVYSKMSASATQASFFWKTAKYSSFTERLSSGSTFLLYIFKVFSQNWHETGALLS